MGYPGRNEERQVLTSHRQVDPVNELKPVVTVEDLRSSTVAVREVKVDVSIENYLLEIANQTRTSDELRVGVSTARRAQRLSGRAGQGRALQSRFCGSRRHQDARGRRTVASSDRERPTASRSAFGRRDRTHSAH